MAYFIACPLTKLLRNFKYCKIKLPDLSQELGKNPNISQLFLSPFTLASCTITYYLPASTYTALRGLASDYLSKLLTIYKPAGHSVRSSSSYNLSVPRSRTTTYGDRTFRSAGPRLWNHLSQTIRNI